MKKRIMAVLMALLIVVSLMTTTAFADNPPVPQINLTSSYDAETNQVTAKVAVGDYVNLYGLTIWMSFDNTKLTVNSGYTEGFVKTNGSSSLNTKSADYVGFSWVTEGVCSGTGENIIVVVFDVIDGQSGSAALKLIKTNINIGDPDDMDYDYSPEEPGEGSITETEVIIPKAPITAVDVSGLESPVKGAAPDTTVTVTATPEADLAATVEWYNGSSKFTGAAFGANTAYTAKITVTASGADNFASEVTGPSGYSLTRSSATQVVLEKTFARTADKEVTGITITSQPSKKEYTEGESFDRTGMEVTASYDDGTSGTITDYLVNPTVMTLGTTSVEVSYAGKYATVTGIKVLKKADASDFTMSPTEVDYDGTAHPVTVSAKPGVSGMGAVSNVKYNGSSEAPVDAGTYKVTFDVAKGTAYAAATGLEAGNLVINKAAQAELTVVADSTVKFGNTLTLGTNGGAGTGAVTYTVANGTGKATVSSNVLTPVHVGTVTVTAEKAADNDYEKAVSQPVEITITKGDALELDNLIVRQSYTVTENTVDLSGTMPEDAGDVTYSLGDFSATGVIVRSGSIDGSNFSYVLENGEEGAVFYQEIIIESENYEDSTVTVEVQLTNNAITVTFDPNGGTATVYSDVVNEDGKLDSLPEAKRAGYTFLGWYTKKVGGDLITTDTVFTEDTTVYAHWWLNVAPIPGSSTGTGTGAGGKLDLSDFIGSYDISFTDVSAADWYYGYVTDMAFAGVINGYPDGSFRPQGNVTWGEALKLVLKATGCGDFEAGSHWASGYMAKALAEGFIDHEVDLDSAITRAEMADLTAKAMKLAASNGANPFEDEANGYAVALYEAGIITGSLDGGHLVYRASSTITRAEMAAIIWRVYTKTAIPSRRFGSLATMQ